MSKISGQFLISGQLWNFRNFRTTGSPVISNNGPLHTRLLDNMLTLVCGWNFQVALHSHCQGPIAFASSQLSAHNLNVSISKTSKHRVVCYFSHTHRSFLLRTPYFPVKETESYLWKDSCTAEVWDKTITAASQNPAEHQLYTALSINIREKYGTYI